jgi:hypothetical protein
MEDDENDEYGGAQEMDENMSQEFNENLYGDEIDTKKIVDKKK